jgi:hypothetical protein
MSYPASDRHRVRRPRRDLSGGEEDRSRTLGRYAASDQAAQGIALAVLVALTAVGWLAGRGGLELTTGVPRDALPAEPGTVLELLAQNTPVAMWPLALVALGWPAIPAIRTLGDLLVVAQLLGHGLLVGAALAAHGGLWRYLPNLPLEWAAIAVPAGGWLTARARTGAVALDRRALMKAGALTGALLIAAAAVETYAVPI